ncbi:family 16 glycoside hydrolase [Pontibacter russatus]|uniref:family 16 glycoside hydrolase n=1 Tax=Pontibacter russatus TaxID=2694929 RepID=UPI00137945A2|nr:family 16 glycoside hydrolase [Pontibacter russatus]
MRKIALLFIALLTVSTAVTGQRKDDKRTLATKIADLLAEMPANDTEQFNASMSEIAAMGKEGIVAMAGMMVDPEQGDNTGLEYALGGFSYYVVQPGQEEWRQLSVDAYCQALTAAGNEENKAFLIRQLQLVGNDAAVPCLQAYLSDARLCAPAAKALININTPKASQALLQALPKAQEDCQLTLVEALGDTRTAEAVAVITPLATSQDEKLRKLALYALANIADPSSEAVLAKAAAEDGFTFGRDNGTAAYLLYTQRLAESGKQQQATEIAQSLLSSTGQDAQVHTRTVALALLTDMQGEQNMPLLLAAASDGNPEYRAAALKFAGDYITPATTDMWVKKLRKAEPEAAAEIITMLGMNHAEAAMPAVIKALRSRKDEVKLAAIGAVGRMGNAEALPRLLKAIRKGDSTEIAAGREALFIMEAEGLTDAVADALPKMPEEAQAAMLQVLGHRAASGRIDDVFAFVKDKDAGVRMAALAALEQMVTKEHLPRLFALLGETTQPEEVLAVQDAIVAAVQGFEDQSERAALVLQQMESVPAEKKPLYFNILASIGGEEALETVVSAFNAGDAATKAAAVAALAQWSDISAATELYRISENPANAEYLDRALRGFVRAISVSDYPAAQKVLMLQEAMAVANTLEQKQLILKETGRNRTFPALVFAGEYLQERGLQQEAAMAVMSIALSDTSFQGDIVRDLLNKTVEVLQGPDSEYQKESIRKFLNEMPKGEGFVSLFNGKDLTGWKGLVEDPIKRAKMDAKTLAAKQKVADEEMRRDWKVENGEITYVGKGYNNLVTEKQYGDFEMFVDWKIYDDGKKQGDAGIYLRGTPQVQMWDTSRVADGAQVGSGGLYNNQVNPSKPLKVADNPLGEWNNFHIIMKGDRVTVYLNGELVTDNVILENYWDRSKPIFPIEQIELQAHGSPVGYRNIYIRELPRQEPFELSAAEKKEGFKVLFDGTNMHNWQGNTADYVIEDGVMVVREPKFGSGGNLYTKEQYGDFVFRFEFMLTPGANNGLGIRTPMEGDAAYEGMEIQILDNDAPIYKDLEEYQFHGSVYGVIPAKRGFLKSVGEWNYEEVIVNGSKIKVILNGTTILDGDIKKAGQNGTLDGKNHPGLKRDKGYIGFLGHGSTVKFRNIRVKDLGKK